MLPVEHHKVLANIRKAEARTKRKRQASEQQNDSDSEAEEPKTKSQKYGVVPSQRSASPPTSYLFALLRKYSFLFSIEDILAETDSDMSEDEGQPRNAQKRAVKPRKARAWLKEGEDDDPLNFLDPKVSQRVLGEPAFLCYIYIYN